MANKTRGEVDIKSRDGKTTWTIRFGANAVCELEDLWSAEESAEKGEAVRVGFPEIGRRLSSGTFTPTMKQARLFVYCALVGSTNPDGKRRYPDATVETAGEVIDAAGFDAAFAGVMESVALAFPTADAADRAAGKGGKGESRGIGRSSSKTPRKLGSVPPNSGA